MAEILNPQLQVANDHKCKNELPHGTDFVKPSMDVLPRGLVARCSCGMLWESVDYGWTYTTWEPAGWWTRFKWNRNVKN